jgi:hypothetical protein
LIDPYENSPRAQGDALPSKQISEITKIRIALRGVFLWREKGKESVPTEKSKRMQKCHWKLNVYPDRQRRKTLSKLAPMPYRQSLEPTA